MLDRIGAGWLGTPIMLTAPITINHEKCLLRDPDPGPTSPSRIYSTVLVKRNYWKVRMDPGWIPQQAIFRVDVIDAVNIIGVLSDPVPITARKDIREADRLQGTCMVTAS